MVLPPVSAVAIVLLLRQSTDTRLNLPRVKAACAISCISLPTVPNYESDPQCCVSFLVKISMSLHCFERQRSLLFKQGPSRTQITEPFKRGGYHGPSA